MKMIMSRWGCIEGSRGEEMNFCAIDFETANNSHDSACSVGIVRVKSNVIVDEFYSLINQKDTWFRPAFIDIHGITAEMTQEAPTFIELWPKMKAFIGRNRLAAHNISFDADVLQKFLLHYGIDWDFPTRLCSLKMSRATWPFLESHKLDVVAEYLDIPLDHHNALSDCRACAKIILAAQEQKRSRKAPE
jgi:DNA polymerase III subunit epsilon